MSVFSPENKKATTRAAIFVLLMKGLLTVANMAARIIDAQ
jgi:hypothetical protein